MGNIVRIIEESKNETDTKILWINFKLSVDLKLLFTPKLENISFIKVNNTLTVNLKNPNFRDYFNEWIERFSKKLEDDIKSENIVEIFNEEIKSIILIGKKEIKLSWETARGLFGELLVLKKYLIENKYTAIEVIEGWQRPAPANHDFEFLNYSIEVKTVSKDSTTVKITSQYQLEATQGKKLYMHCFRIERMEKSKIDSLGELYCQIMSLLPKSLINIFEMKCIENDYCAYLGPELMPLDYKFILIEENLYFIDQISFPRVKKEELNAAVSKFSYSIDISSFKNYKIN